jgi:hypothetical protein
VKRIRRFLPLGAAVTTVLVVVGVALSASLQESPLAETVPGVQSPDALEKFAGILDLPSGQRSLMTLALVLLGIASVTFVIAARLAWHGVISMRLAIVTAILLHVLILPAPILFSRDVYNYVMYGRIVSEHGANPYVAVPADFPDDRLVPHIGYQDVTSVYGPAFVTLSAGVTTVTSSTATAVWTFKVIAGLCSLASMLLAVKAARLIRPERAVFAAVLIGWNPVVVLHAVGGAHNDALVTLALAAGALLALKRRFPAATLCLAVGALVKVIVLLPLVVLVAGALAMTPAGRRVVTLGAHLGIALGTALFFAIPYLQTEDPTFGAAGASQRFGVGSDAVRSIASAVGLDSVAEPIARIAQGIAPFVMVIATISIALYLIKRGADPATTVAGMGWVLLVTFLFSDQHFPWYGMWFVPIAWILPRAARSAVLILSAALTLLHPWRPFDDLERWVLWVFYLGLAVVAIVLLRVIIELVLRLLMRREAGVGGGALMVEEGPRLPWILRPLGSMDAVAPPARQALNGAPVSDNGSSRVDSKGELE